MAALAIPNLVRPIPELLPHIRADLQIFGVPLGGPKARTCGSEFDLLWSGEVCGLIVICH